MALFSSEARFKYPQGKGVFCFALNYYSFLKLIFASVGDRIFQETTSSVEKGLEPTQTSAFTV
jgi:hypothetical protein